MLTSFSLLQDANDLLVGTLALLHPEPPLVAVILTHPAFLILGTCHLEFSPRSQVTVSATTVLARACLLRMIVFLDWRTYMYYAPH